MVEQDNTAPRCSGLDGRVERRVALSSIAVVPSGRARFAVIVVLALLALALYLYSERAVPPEPPTPVPPRPESVHGDAAVSVYDTATADARAPEGSADTGAPSAAADPPEGIDEAHAPDPPSPARSAANEGPDGAGVALRVAIAERLSPEELELLVSGRLIERLVATIHSLDRDPVPLRFRPLAHVPGLPRVEATGDGWRLPDAPDPRYRIYRALFERFDAAALAALYERHEPAFDAAWRALGEDGPPEFRARLIEVLDHLAAFESPANRPRLVRPEVLYEYADPRLEALSWGRKILVRIGPAHAGAVRRKARALARALERPAVDTGAALGPD